MKKFAKLGAAWFLLIGMSMAVVGCSGGDAGMGKKEYGSVSGVVQ
ncbi:MAG: hypothetical protein ACU843_02750 [Gammaproteobacteria bacterium]